MLRPKKNSYKVFDNEKKFLRLKNYPLPIIFLMVRPLGQTIHSIPKNGISKSQVLPNSGLFLCQFFPSIGIKTSHFIPNNGISRSQVLPNNGLYLSLVFPNIGIEISHPNPNKSRIDKQLLSKSTKIMHFLFKQF